MAGRNLVDDDVDGVEWRVKSVHGGVTDGLNHGTDLGGRSALDHGDCDDRHADRLAVEGGTRESLGPRVHGFVVNEGCAPHPAAR